jgi:aspartyl protease family protein
MAKRPITGLLLVVLLFPMPALMATEPLRIQVMGLFRDKVVVRINGKQSILRTTDEVVNGVRLIRSNSKRAIIEVNGESREYRLGSNVSTRLTVPKSNVVRIPGNRGMYKTQGLINGRSVQFLVDTGASVVAMARPTADRLQIPYREQGSPMKVSTASQLKNAWHVKLNSVTVGGITLHQVDGTVIDTEHEQEILLGMSFLNRVRFSQDQGVVVLEANSN